MPQVFGNTLGVAEKRIGQGMPTPAKAGKPLFYSRSEKPIFHRSL
jgi:hypothetical protein